VGKSEAKKHWEDLGVDGWMVLKWILWKYRYCGLHSSCSGEGPLADFCEHGEETSCFIRFW
jgi:hypothetical protein